MDGWTRAKAVAAELSPASVWRRKLADALRGAEGVVTAAVLTCPPGDPYAAQGDVAPPDLREKVMKSFLNRMLKRIDRRDPGGAGSAVVSQLGSRAYAPLDAAADRQLAEEVMQEIVAPTGAAGLLNAFLVDAKEAPVGWIAVWTALPASQALQVLGDPLSEVAAVASRTLQTALELAMGVGAIEPKKPSKPLSSREKQVASLVSQGLSDLNIAAELRISEHTVGAHLRRIFGKLGVHSRVELARIAGQVGPGNPGSGEVDSESSEEG